MLDDGTWRQHYTARARWEHREVRENHAHPPWKYQTDAGMLGPRGYRRIGSSQEAAEAGAERKKSA